MKLSDLSISCSPKFIGALFYLYAGVALSNGLLAGTATLLPGSSSLRVNFSQPVGAVIPPAEEVRFEDVPVVVITGDGREQVLGLEFSLTPPFLSFVDQGDASALRISDVDPTGFTVQYQRRENNSVAVTPTLSAIEFSYIAVEQGVTELPGGFKLEAGRVDASAFNNPLPISFTTDAFSEKPATFSEFQTLNAPESWQVSNSYGTTQLGTTLVASNRSGTIPAAAESIGYIAITQGEIKFLGSDGLEVRIKSLSDQAGIGGLGDFEYPPDCNSVPLGDTYLLQLAKQSSNNQSGGVVKSCGIDPGLLDQMPLYIDTERLNGNRATPQETIDALAISRPFYGFFGLVSDYHFDGCNISGANTAIADSGPYMLDGSGDGLTRVNVADLASPAPLCSAAAFSAPNSLVSVDDNERFDINSTVTMAAWVRHDPNAPNSVFPDRQTIAGKGTDAYRLVIEKICTIETNGVRLIDEASTNGLGLNLCDLTSGAGLGLSSEIYYIIRFEVTNDITGATTFLRSTQVGINQPSTFFDPSGKLVDGEWGHVSASFDGFTLRVALNQTIVAEFISSSAIPLRTNNQPFTVGASINPLGIKVDEASAIIDEVTLWQNALSLNYLDAEHRSRFRPCTACGRNVIYRRETYNR